MRISEIAEAAGTTVRTVRHYHRLGLMPEPPRSSNGYRVYALEDLVRLMRIRWLAGSGVPLGSVPAVLGTAADPDARDDLAADLEALLSDADRQLKMLQGKRAALAAMLDGHRRGEILSPLPEPLTRAFAELIAGEDDPRTRELFVRERDSWEIVALSGQAPQFLLDATIAVLADTERRPTVVALYRRFGALAGLDPVVAADEIDAVADGFAGFLAAIDESGGGDVVAEWAQEAAAVVALDDSMMCEVLPDPAQRAVVVRVIVHVAAVAAGETR